MKSSENNEKKQRRKRNKQSKEKRRQHEKQCAKMAWRSISNQKSESSIRKNSVWQQIMAASKAASKRNMAASKRAKKRSESVKKAAYQTCQHHGMAQQPRV